MRGLDAEEKEFAWKLTHDMLCIRRRIHSEEADVHAKGLPIIKAIRLFDTVVTSCFGMTVDENYMRHIENFRNAYLDLDIFVTLKVFTFEVIYY